MSSYVVPSSLTRIKMPTAEAIRRNIAAEAAKLSGQSVDHYLGLLGRVEPAAAVHDGSWRLASYHGDHRDGDYIERAITIVLRRHPMMR